MPTALVSLKVEAIDYIEGMRQKTEADKAAVDSSNKLGDAIEQTDRKLSASGTRGEQAAKQYDAVYKAQTLLEQKTRDLDRAFQIYQQTEGQSGISAEVHARATAGLRDAVERLTTGAVDASGGLKSSASSAREAAEAHNNLSTYSMAAFHSLRGLTEQVASGVPIYMALSREINNITYAASGPGGLIGAFSGVGTIARDLFRSLAPLLGPIGLVTAAFGTLAIGVSRLNNTRQNIRDFSAELDILGRDGVATGTQMQTAFEHLRDSGVSSAEALQSIQLITRNPLVNQARAEELGKLARDVAAFSGKAVPQATAELIQAFTHGSDEVIKYAQSYDLITAAQAKEIRDTGNLEIALDEFHRKFDGYRERTLSPYAKASDEVSKSWNQLLDTLAQTGVITAVSDALVAVARAIPSVVEGIQNADKTVVGFLAKVSGGPNTIMLSWNATVKEIEHITEVVKAAIDWFDKLYNKISNAPQESTKVAQQSQEELAKALEQRGATPQDIQNTLNPPPTTGAPAYYLPRADLAEMPQGGRPLPEFLALPTPGAAAPPSSAWDNILNNLGRALQYVNPISGAHAAEMSPATNEDIVIQEQNTDATRLNTDAVKANVDKISWLPGAISDTLAQKFPAIMDYMIGRMTQSSAPLIAGAAQAYHATPEDLTPGSPSATARSAQAWDRWFGWTGMSGNPQISQGLFGLGGAAGQSQQQQQEASAPPIQNMIETLGNLRSSLDALATRVETLNASMSTLSDRVSTLASKIEDMPAVLGAALADSLGRVLAGLKQQLESQPSGLRYASYQGPPVAGTTSTTVSGSDAQSELSGVLAYASQAERNVLSMIQQRENSAGDPSLLHYPAAGQSATVATLADVFAAAVTKNSHAFGLYGIQPETYRGAGGGQDISAEAQNYVALNLLRTYGPNASQTWGASAPPGGYPTAGLERAQLGVAMTSKQQDDFTQQQTKHYQEQIQVLQQRDIIQKATAAFGQVWNSEEGKKLDFAERNKAAWAAYTHELDVGDIAIRKQTEDAQRLAQGTLNSADAFRNSTQQGLQANAWLQASTEIFNKFGNTQDHVAEIQQRYTEILNQQAATALLSGNQQFDTLKRTVSAQEAVAAESERGAAATKAEQINQQATAQAYDLYTKAVADGNTALKGRAEDLREVIAQQLKANEAAQETTQLNLRNEQTRQATEVAQLEVSLQGQTADEIARQVGNLKLAQDIKTKYADVTDPKILQSAKDATEAYGQWGIKLAEARAQAQRLDEEVRGIAETISNTLSTAIDDMLSGKKIDNWGERFQTMLRSIASTIIKTELVNPLLGSLFQGISPQLAQSYGTLGGGGGGGLLSNLLGIGQTAGTLNSSTSGGGGLLSGLGGLLGIGGSALPSTGALLEAGGGAAGVVGGASGATAGVVGAATGVTEAATPLAASAAASATAGGVGLLGAAGAAIPYVGAAIAAAALISSLIKAPPPTNATGGTINLGAPGGTINLQTTGTSVNAGAAGSLLNPISQFASNLYSQTGGNVPGQIAGQAFTNKQGQAVYQLDFAGPQGTVKAQFASAQDAVNAAELAIAHNLQGVGDAMKKALSTVTDPSQIQDAINFVNVYTKVNTAFDNMFSNFEGASKAAGPYAQGLAQINSTYNDLAQNAKKYTLDQTPIVAAADAAFARLRDDFNTNIQDMTTALSSSFAGTLKAEKEAGQQRINDAIAVGGKLDEVEKYNAANLEKMAIGAANQLAQMGSQFDNVVGQLADSLRTSFSSVETQLTNGFKSVGNLDLLSGSDPFSQAFNQIRTQAEAARQAAATTYPTTAGGFQGRIDAAMKQWQDLSDQSLKFVENTGAMSNSLENGAVAALNYATALKESADQQAVLGQAVQAALTGVEEAAIARLRTDFDANIQNLTTALTDPVQAAVTQEYEAGQNRIAIAKQVGGDLAAVEQYNEKNLQRVAQQAVTATNDISKAIEAAVGKIGSLATTGNLGTIGTFGQAIQQAVSPTAATTGVFTKAVADLNDALGQAVQTITQLTQGTPDFTALLKGYADSLDTLRSSFNQQIQDLLLAMTDPVQAAINAELKAGQQRVADAQNIGADLAAVDEYNTQNLEKVGQAALQSADNVADLTSQLQTFNQSLQQLLSGPLSGLTPAQQVTTSQAKFEGVLGAVKGGDLTRLGELGTAGTETVQASVTAYGNSGKTAEIRNKIVSDLQEVSKSSDVVTAQSKADANSATATSKDLSDKYATQVAAADDYANQLQAASDDYKSKHGEVNQALQNEADSAKATAAEFHKVLVANTGITRAVVDSATVRLGALQQEVDAARRSATTAQASADVADKALAIQQDILDKQTKTLQSLLDSQIAVAQNIIDAQQKMADAFSASVDRFVSALSTATQAAQAAQGPSASPWGNADWGNYRITGDVGWSGTVILDPAQAELWKSRQYVINPIKAEVPGHPGYGTYDVYLNMPISTDVWGTGEFAKYWQSSGLRVSPNFQGGGIMAHPGWALVGEAGPEYVKLPGGAQVLPHGVMPPAGGSNESSLSEPMLHALQEMHATMQALLKQTQGGHRQSTSDAKAIVGEVSELRREVAFGGATMRRAV